jgi:hypothetical protein
MELVTVIRAFGLACSLLAFSAMGWFTVDTVRRFRRK